MADVLEYGEFKEDDSDMSDFQEIDISETDDFQENEDTFDINDIQIFDEIEDVDIENLEDISIEDVDTENSEDISIEDDDLYLNNLIRDVLDQNVNEQRIPSDAVAEWSEDGEKGNSDCVLKDDAEFIVRYKSTGEQKKYTGAEFKDYMQEKYGRDYVTYMHKEPDFKPFEQCIDKEEFEEFLLDKYGTHVKVEEVPEGHMEVECMGTNRKDTYGAAYECFKEMLGNEVSKKDIEEYMKKKDLTWHECGDRKTIQIIPTEINQVFSHTGGIGIEKDFEAFSSSLNDVITSDIDEDIHSYKLEKIPMAGKTEGLDDAIKYRYKKNKEKKSEMF